MANTHNNVIEVDPAMLENEEDCGYESAGYETSTDSLSSSINEYIFENGRRYHSYFGTDKNLQPTDETEQDRLDIHHEIFLKLLDDDLHKAPIDKCPSRILDIGTGTGLWAIDMADKYPSAEVIGTDLSPIQPQWVPPNCSFQVDDAEMDFTFSPDSFDFVHVRNLAQGISDWDRFLGQIFTIIKPGAYVEIGELGFVAYSDDDTMPDDHGVKVFIELLSKAVTSIGRPPVDSRVLSGHLIKAGFEDVVAYDIKEPYGPWAKDRKLKQVGAMNLLSAVSGFHAYGLAAFTHILGMDAAEADKICNNAIAVARNKNHHVYSYYHLVYARKPLE